MFILFYFNMFDFLFFTHYNIKYKYLGEINMQKQHVPTQTKIDLNNFAIRLGKIFSNISILFLILSFCGILSFVATAFIFLIGFILIILSIGTVFVYIPNYWDNLTNASRISAEISSFFLQYWYIFIAFTILFSILSLIFLKLDKNNKHTARIVISSIVVGIAIVAIIVILTGVIK